MTNLTEQTNIKIEKLNKCLKKLKTLGGQPSNKNIMKKVKQEKRICTHKPTRTAMQSLHGTLEAAIDCLFMDITVAQALKLGYVEEIVIKGVSTQGN